ncbi:hypothetical protein [Haloarchaeobius sp. TZWWS8]|uniref:hypothetical protein n=1 Tax=Haloarchaeobius sp. TZWWS8 TaxID=3446121 RepID=UPI003EBB9508
MNAKQTVKLVSYYRALAFAFFVIGWGLVAAGVYLSNVRAASELVLQDPLGAIAALDLVTFGVLTVLGLAVWQLGKSVAMVKTIGRAVAAAENDESDQQLKSEVLDVVNDQMSSLEADLRSEIRTASNDSGSGRTAVAATTSGPATTGGSNPGSTSKAKGRSSRGTGSSTPGRSGSSGSTASSSAASKRSTGTDSSSGSAAGSAGRSSGSTGGSGGSSSFRESRPKNAGSSERNAGSSERNAGSSRSATDGRDSGSSGASRTDAAASGQTSTREATSGKSSSETDTPDRSRRRSRETESSDDGSDDPLR